MWSVLGIWNSHTDIITTGIMMIQSAMLTPALPDQDEEKLSASLCVKSKKSIQTNHESKNKQVKDECYCIYIL